MEQKQFESIRVTAVPALHIALTRGFVIETEGKNFYFHQYGAVPNHRDFRVQISKQNKKALSLFRSTRSD
jgi:hypothetical protein